MSFDTIKSQSEKELRGRLNELNGEIFKARFSTEQMNPRKGSDIRKRRIEIAQIHTALQSRVALARHQQEVKQLELRLAGMGKPHEGSVEDKRRRSLVAARLADVQRAISELSYASTKTAKPAKAEKPAAEKAEKKETKAEKPAAEKPAAEKKEAKAEKPAKAEAKAEPKKEAKKEAKAEAKAEPKKEAKKEAKADKEEKPKAKKKADK